jgi:hypothetical protein
MTDYDLSMQISSVLIMHVMERSKNIRVVPSSLMVWFRFFESVYDHMLQGHPVDSKKVLVLVVNPYHCFVGLKNCLCAQFGCS